MKQNNIYVEVFDKFHGDGNFSQRAKAERPVITVLEAIAACGYDIVPKRELPAVTLSQTRWHTHCWDSLQQPQKTACLNCAGRTSDAKIIPMYACDCSEKRPITRREQTAKLVRESKSPCKSKWLP